MAPPAPAFYDDPVAVRNELADIAGNQPDPVLMNFRFLGNANEHVSTVC